MLREHGGDRKSEEARNQGDYSNLDGRGNDKSYWSTRLKRDCPEIHDALQRGGRGLTEEKWIELMNKHDRLNRYATKLRKERSSEKKWKDGPLVSLCVTAFISFVYYI